MAWPPPPPLAAFDDDEDEDETSGPLAAAAGGGEEGKTRENQVNEQYFRFVNQDTQSKPLTHDIRERCSTIELLLLQGVVVQWR